MPWTAGVLVALTAICLAVALRSASARGRPVVSAASPGAAPASAPGAAPTAVPGAASADLPGRAERLVRHCAAALLGFAAFGEVTVLLRALHNPGGPGYVVTVPGLAALDLLPATLLLPALLLAILPAYPPGQAPGRRTVPITAAVAGSVLAWPSWLTSTPPLPLMDHLVGGLAIPLLAAAAAAALPRLTAPPAGSAAPASASATPWALLLPGVATMVAGLLGFPLWAPAEPGTGIGLAVTYWSIGLAVLVALGTAALHRPRAAAHLATLGLLAVGAYGVIQGGFSGSLLEIRTFGTPVGPPPGLPSELSHHITVLAGIHGALLLALGLWLLPRTVLPDLRRMLGREPDPALSRRVQELAETRAEAVSSAAAELRRIERDLHDGAQGRLVTIGMNLRVAEELIRTSPAEAAALVVEARVSSATALEELRSLVRGTCPPVLADRGLGEAVRALSRELPLPCETEIDLPVRLDLPLESACYFATAELVTNAVRHSSASTLRIHLTHTDGRLRLYVADDGIGGADPSRGTGLAGVERRMAAFDGILTVSSPPGGPTVVALEVPCG
ncbi:sensor histidine kinase [Kitasatospora sp. MMS16-BH015]|uniref:sensor histidine kinase n=1 Tax=Kitasatospora sp. MMS16-BH015 TaxID=2018025 RepID=UPI0020C57F72|nr:histidine kinase [Kitasatospora sp. MMS16-BH015]